MARDVLRVRERELTMERFTRWAMGVVVWGWGGLALAQDASTAPTGLGPATVVEWSDAMAKAGGWGVAVVLFVVLVWREKQMRADRAVFDAEIKGLNGKVVELLQGFLHDRK